MPDQGKILMPDQIGNQPVELDFSQAEYKRFYANHVTSTMSLFEVRAIFSSVQGIDPQAGKLVVDETLHVRMAPELALALVQTLQTTLRDYVKMFGGLRPTRQFPPATAGTATTSETPKSEPATAESSPDNPPQPGS